jgi:hypothetical protein
MLIGAGQEEYILAVEPLEAGQRVGCDRLIGVTDMRIAVGIGDRGRDVEFLRRRRSGFRHGVRRIFRLERVGRFLKVEDVRLVLNLEDAGRFLNLDSDEINLHDLARRQRSAHGPLGRRAAFGRLRIRRGCYRGLLGNGFFRLGLNRTCRLADALLDVALLADVFLDVFSRTALAEALLGALAGAALGLCALLRLRCGRRGAGARGSLARFFRAFLLRALFRSLLGCCLGGFCLTRGHHGFLKAQYDLAG